MKLEIRKAQELVFSIMEHSTFNNFDGRAVVQALREHRQLWRGVIFGHTDGHGWYGVRLRDISANIYHADTMHVEARAGKEAELLALAQTFHADECDYVSVPHAGRALRLWWD